MTDELHRIGDTVRNEAGLVELLQALEADRRVTRAADERCETVASRAQVGRLHD